MIFKNKKIFVSGGAGVIGNELCPLLVEMGAIVMVGDLKPKPLNWSPEIVYRQGDLNYIKKAELEIFGPEVFIHLAATFERSTETYEFWNENFWHNVHLSHHLIGLLKDISSVKRVIFASSYLIYNPQLYSFSSPQTSPYRLKETDAVYPRNLTGMAKFSHEVELRFLQGFKNDTISFVSVRIYRGYGKGSRCVISRWIRSLLNNEPIKVYRKEGIFDYIYAGDTAKGLTKLIEFPNISGIINLGTGRARKVSEVVDVLSSHFPGMSYEEVESDIPFEASECDTSLFEAQTNWKPERSIEETIPEIIEYEKRISKALNHQSEINVLVTSIARKVPMLKAIKHAGKKIGSNIRIYGGDTNPLSIGKYFVDEFWKLPLLDESSIDKILEYCDANNIKAIIPSRDGELAYWAMNKSKLEGKGINVMVSNSESIDICIDKLKFSQELSKKAIQVIPSFLDIKDVQSSILVVKERYGAGSKNIGIGISKEDALKFAKKLDNPIFQPYIKGNEFSVDIYVAKNNNVKGVIVRSRDIVINGESQVTTTLSKHELESIAVSFAKQLKLYGHIVLQVIEDEENRYHIIECNSRFGGASTLSIAAGLDTFYWFILESMNTDIHNYPFVKSEIALTQVRYPEDIILNDTDL
jgi:carbamoyl-phosphate synthase large subunit